MVGGRTLRSRFKQLISKESTVVLEILTAYGLWQKNIQGHGRKSLTSSSTSLDG